MERTFGFFGLSFKDPNKGCEALTYTLLDMLQRLYPNDKLHLKGFVPLDELGEAQKTYPDLDLKGYYLNIRSPKSWYNIYQEVKKCDCIFDASYGDGFTGIYGTARNFVQALRKQLPVWAHKPYYLLPQTYGSYKFPFVKWSLGLIKKATLAYARDETTAKEVGPFVKVTSDMAFRLPYDKNKYRFESKAPRFGISVSSLLWDDDTRERFGLTVDYHKFYLDLIDYLINETDYEVHLIAHVVDADHFDAPENDFRICSLLKEKYSDNERVALGPIFKTAIEAKSYISNMDIFLGSRMHATIGAISSGVVTIPFSYAYKFETLYSKLDYPYIISAKGMTTDEALIKTKEWISNPHLLREKGIKAVEKAQKELTNFEEDLKQSLRKEGLMYAL